MRGRGDLVRPVADRDSRDQEGRGDHVVRMAPIRNKTAECAEGRGGSVNVAHVRVIVSNSRVDFKYYSRMVNMVMKW